jgi:hypothetical protein
MVTVQSGFRASDFSITGPTALTVPTKNDTPWLMKKKTTHQKNIKNNNAHLKYTDER